MDARAPVSLSSKKRCNVDASMSDNGGARPRSSSSSKDCHRRRGRDLWSIYRYSVSSNRRFTPYLVDANDCSSISSSYSCIAECQRRPDIIILYIGLAVTCTTCCQQGVPVTARFRITKHVVVQLQPCTSQLHSSLVYRDHTAIAHTSNRRRCSRTFPTEVSTYMLFMYNSF